VLSDTRIALEGEGDGEPASIMFVLDPNGNRIELIQHTDEASVEGHRQFIKTGNLGWAEKPLGTVRAPG
jgi:hypothetical protein